MTQFRAPLAVCLCALAGCAGDRVQHVKGTVTFGGVPVPAGVIWFDPDVTRGNTTGSQGYAQIRDGQFDTRTDGQGVRPGAYRIRVEGFDGKPANELPFGRPLTTEAHEQNHDFGAGDSELIVDVPDPRKKR